LSFEVMVSAELPYNKDSTMPKISKRPKPRVRHRRP